MTEQLYRWVKASERMPKTGVISFARIDGHLLSLIQVSVNTGKIHFAGVLKPTEYPYSIIEWLEPYTPSPVSGSLEETISAQAMKSIYQTVLCDGSVSDDLKLEVTFGLISEMIKLKFAGYSKGGEEKSEGYLIKSVDNKPDKDGWYYVLNLNKELFPRMLRVVNGEFENLNELRVFYWLKPFASRPSLDIDKVVEGKAIDILKEALADHENDKIWLLEKYPQINEKIGEAVRPWINKAKQLLNQKEAK